MIGRILLAVLALAGLSGRATGPALAQSYPTKLIELVAGYPAAGASGRIARLVGPALQQALSRPVEVKDVLGNDGNNAAAYVARAAADGHTLLLTTTGMVTFNSFIHKNLSFDPQRDFAAISLVAEVDNVLLVRPDFPAKTMAELVAMAKPAPGKVSYARVDVASTNTLATFLLANLAGVELAMTMKWDTVVPSMQAVVNGEVDLSMQNIPAALPLIREGKLRALATTGRKRAQALSDVPTIGETIADYRASAWFGIVAPRATPRDIVRLLNGHISRFLAQPETQARFAELGADTVGGSPDDFETFIQTERNKWRRVVTAAKIGAN
jgi:tripartite-type tricarboxylate transporter receptor subunit TctC